MEILNSIRLNEEPPALLRKKKKKIVTLNSIADIYFKEREAFSSDNVKSYQKYSTKLKVQFGECDLHEITTNKILDFQRMLKQQGLAALTINYTITFLGTLFNIAIDEELYNGQNPAKHKKINKIKVDNNRERYLTAKDIDILYDNIDDEVLKLFVDLSLSTGGRLETILNIKTKDINLDNSMITLKDIKNNSTYNGFIPDDLKSFLIYHLEKLSSNYFVVGGDVTKYATRTLQRKLQKILNELFNNGLETKDSKNRVVIHTLRHTFASHLAINGTPIFTIQKLMNHRDIKQTSRYAKLAPDSGKEFINGLYK